MTRIFKKNLGIIIFGSVVLAGWVLTDLCAPRSSDLREFDPQEVAWLETQMWRAYYNRQRLRLFEQMAGLLRRQYHVPLLRSHVLAFHAARAAFIFKDGYNRSDYELALPDLIRYYSALRKISEIPFDADTAARLELEWWIIHRERATHPAGDLDRSLAELAAEIYRLPAESFAEHAKYRAQAMIRRDELAESSGVTEADWDRIHQLLRQSWSSLWQAVRG